MFNYEHKLRLGKRHVALAVNKALLEPGWLSHRTIRDCEPSGGDQWYQL